MAAAKGSLYFSLRHNARYRNSCHVGFDGKTSVGQSPKEVSRSMSQSQCGVILSLLLASFCADWTESLPCRASCLMLPFPMRLVWRRLGVIVARKISVDDTYSACVDYPPCRCGRCSDSGASAFNGCAFAAARTEFKASLEAVPDADPDGYPLSFPRKA